MPKERFSLDKKDDNNQNYLKILVALAVFVFVVFGFLLAQYLLKQNSTQSQQTQTTTSNSSDLKSDILTSLAKIIILPNEPDPQVATISNIDQLKSQDPEFYANAVNGDTLIIYTNEAIIFRSSQNKIVNVAQIQKSAGS